MFERNTEGTIDKLRAFFELKNEIQMAFLFGSAATGREIQESDVDVAVWIKEGYSLDVIGKLQGEIELLLHRDVDLIVLNSARPTVAWAAMQGKSLIIRDYKLYFRKMLDFSAEAEDFRNFIFELWALRRKLRGEFA